MVDVVCGWGGCGVYRVLRTINTRELMEISGECGYGYLYPFGSFCGNNYEFMCRSCVCVCVCVSHQSSENGGEMKASVE